MTTDTGNSLQEIRALVIDDDAGIRKVIALGLENQGCEVTTASDGREALEILLEHDFDVALVDIKMERMDGFAFLLEARRVRPWLGLIVVTGYVDESTTSRAKDLGIEHVVAKPIDMKQLVPLIQSEAGAKKSRLAMPAAFSLDRFRYELEMLRKLGRSAIESNDLSAALRTLAVGLGEIVPSTAIAILTIEEEPLLTLYLNEPVSSRYLAALENNLRLRYRALSGEDLPEELKVEVEGAPANAEEPSEVGTCHMIPIIQASEIRGLLLFSSENNDRRGEREIAFLYHTANHLATIIAAFRRIKALTIYDPPTGLMNRPALIKQLGYLTEVCRANDLPLSIVGVDAYDLHAVAEQHGRVVVNTVIAELAQRLKEASDTSATLGRCGPGQILIVMPGGTRKDAEALAEVIRKEVAAPVFGDGGLNIQLDMAIGTLTSGKRELAGTPPEEMLARVSAANMAAARLGGTGIVDWSEDLERS